MPSNDELRAVLKALNNGDLSMRLPEDETGIEADFAIMFNESMHRLNRLVEMVNQLSSELSAFERLEGYDKIEGLADVWARLHARVRDMELALADDLQKVIASIEGLIADGPKNAWPWN